MTEPWWWRDARRPVAGDEPRESEQLTLADLMQLDVDDVLRDVAHGGETEGGEAQSN